MLISEHPDALRVLSQFALGLVAAGLILYSGLQALILSGGRYAGSADESSTSPGEPCLFVALLAAGIGIATAHLPSAFAPRIELLFSVLATALAVSAFFLAFCFLRNRKVFFCSRTASWVKAGLGMNALAQSLLLLVPTFSSSATPFLPVGASAMTGTASLCCFLPLNRFHVKAYREFQLAGSVSRLGIAFGLCLLVVAGLSVALKPTGGEGGFERFPHPIPVNAQDAADTRNANANRFTFPDRLLEENRPVEPHIRGRSALLTYGGVALLLAMAGTAMASLRQSARLLQESHHRQLLEERSKIFSTLKHEAGTALQVIVGYSHLLLSEPCTKRQRTMLKRLAENSSLLNRIVEDSASAPLPLSDGNRSSEIHLQSFFKDVAWDFKLTNGARIRKLHLELAEDLPETALLDGCLLRQILTNLLWNAATHGGRSPRIKLTATRIGERPHSNLRIVVSDNGPGIPEELERDLFAPFTKGPASGGDGLGLCVVRESIGRMSGTVSYSKSPGGGASFEMILPLNTPPGPSAEEPGRPTLLIVDDHPAIRELLRKFTSDSGWDSILSESGDSAMEQANIRSPEVALVDLRLGGSTGSELLRALRARHPGIFLVAMSAGPTEETKRAAKEAGADAVLTKPFSSRDLEHLLRFRETSSGKGFSPDTHLQDLRKIGDEALKTENTRNFAKIAHEAANDAFALGQRLSTEDFSNAEELAKADDWVGAADLWKKGWARLTLREKRNTKI